MEFQMSIEHAASEGIPMMGLPATPPTDSSEPDSASAPRAVSLADQLNIAAEIERKAVDAKDRRSPLLLAGAAGAAAYLYGSLPVVYLLGRQRSVDLRRVGSGNVGATNLLVGGAPARSVAGWLFDASKGCVPIWVCRRLGFSEEVSQLAGVCGVAGQCWPLFLRFRGGRGISAFVGASSQMADVLGWSATLAPLAGGGLWRVLGKLARHTNGRASARSKSVPFGCFLGATAFPFVCAVHRPRRRGTRLAPSLVTVVLLLRRLTAPLPDDAVNGPAVRRQALIYRLLYDRNTSD
jgi:glycerol-3-phosphate acyltransferase PlsY